MKKTLSKFEDKRLSNIKNIKGGNKSEEHSDLDDDETKQAKNRRVTFQLIY